MPTPFTPKPTMPVTTKARRRSRPLCAKRPNPKRPARSRPTELFRLQYQGQSVAGVADDHYFRIAAGRQLFRGFNAFPLKQLRADSLRHNFLKVRNTLRFDALALGFLLLFLQDEIHAQGVLFGLLFGFDGAFSIGGSCTSR